MGREQLELFDDPRDPTRPGGVRAVEADDETRAVAAALPARYRAGTSSWSFPGWADLVYGRNGARAPGRERLAREGLPAYASHPLLRCVGLDRSFYTPLEADVYARYAAQVPDDFRFVVKAHEDCVLARFPGHRRYGERAGSDNPRYLDPHWANDRVLGPAMAGLGEKLGVLLFQLPPQSERALGSPAHFAAALHAFLGRLDAPCVAVELRNPELLTPAYIEALRDVGAVHCVNAHPTMPRPADQWLRAGPLTGPLVVRWMLRAGFRYEEARQRYAPFDRLRDPDPGLREEIASACVDALGDGRAAFVIANNKAEGSAPLSVFRLAERLAEAGIGQDHATDAERVRAG